MGLDKMSVPTSVPTMEQRQRYREKLEQQSEKEIVRDMLDDLTKRINSVLNRLLKRKQISKKMYSDDIKKLRTLKDLFSDTDLNTIRNITKDIKNSTEDLINGLSEKEKVQQQQNEKIQKTLKSVDSELIALYTTDVLTSNQVHIMRLGQYYTENILNQLSR